VSVNTSIGWLLCIAAEIVAKLLVRKRSGFFVANLARSGSDGGSRLNFPFDLASKLISGNFQILGALKVPPKTSAGVELSRQPQGGVFLMIVHNLDVSPQRNDLATEIRR
jgi:hypothetical protein